MGLKKVVNPSKRPGLDVQRTRYYLEIEPCTALVEAATEAGMFVVMKTYYLNRGDTNWGKATCDLKVYGRS
jgi:hypothetical protein